jgi:predicted nucleic acid-binding protein
VRRVFADAMYFIAVIFETDRAHARALAFDDTDPDLRIITSDGIILEFLAYVSARGTYFREVALLQVIDELRADPRVTIIRMTPELFDAALELYRARPDKAYSLVDCMSMVICQQEAIGEVLTHDHHFQQEGFAILL